MQKNVGVFSTLRQKMIQLNSGWFGGRPALASAQLREARDWGFYRISLLPGEPRLKMEGLAEARADTGARFGAAAMDSLRQNDHEGLDEVIPRLKELGSSLLIIESPLLAKEALVASAEQLLSRQRAGANLDGDEACEQFRMELADDSSAEQHLEHLVRRLHAACHSYPGLKIALKPHSSAAGLLNPEYFRLLLGELAELPVGLWYCPGTAHTRMDCGLEAVGDWLELAPHRIFGCSLQDYAEGVTHLLPGDGVVDFQSIAEYIPRDCQKVLAVAPAYPKEDLLEVVRLLDSYGIK
jgi:sugar phosphate isomerase/epimerase